MHVTMGVAGAALFVASLLPAPAAPRARTVADAARALVYGQAASSWAERAAELCARDAGATAAFGRLAMAGNLDGVARGRILEALARAGSPKAQEAMRQALSSPALRADGAYPLLVAQLERVGAPTVETLSFLAETRAQALAAGETQLAAAASDALDTAYSHRLSALGSTRLHQARSPIARKR